MKEQVLKELSNRDLPIAGVQVLAARVGWVSIHQAHGERGQATNAAKIGYEVNIHFPLPQPGPIMLGHSSHFGLGLFAPHGYGKRDYPATVTTASGAVACRSTVRTPTLAASTLR